MNYSASNDTHQYWLQLSRMCAVICIWGGPLADLGLRLSGKGAVIFELGRPSSRPGSPTVGDMCCHLHLERPSGRPAAPAVVHRCFHVHFGPSICRRYVLSFEFAVICIWGGLLTSLGVRHLHLGQASSRPEGPAVKGM